MDFSISFRPQNYLYIGKQHIVRMIRNTALWPKQEGCIVLQLGEHCDHLYPAIKEPVPFFK